MSARAGPPLPVPLGAGRVVLAGGHERRGERNAVTLVASVALHLIVAVVLLATIRGAPTIADPPPAIDVTLEVAGARGAAASPLLPPAIVAATPPAPAVAASAAVPTTTPEAAQVAAAAPDIATVAQTPPPDALSPATEAPSPATPARPSAPTPNLPPPVTTTRPRPTSQLRPPPAPVRPPRALAGSAPEVAQPTHQAPVQSDAQPGAQSGAQSGAQLGAPSGGGVARPASSDASAISPAWRGAVFAWLQSHKTYPDQARRRGEEGSALIRFSVGRDGRVIDYELLRKTGFDSLDNAVQQLLRDARMPAFPASMTQDKTTLTVQIRYEGEQ